MKKYITIIIICMVLLSITACKKTSVETAVNPQATATESANNVESSPSGEKEVTSTAVDGKPVTNEGLIAEIQAFVEMFYYNFLFAPQLETGELTETDKQLFAISYIYQHEHEGLRFDSEKFLLYIPEANVSEVIKRYFDYEFTQHKYPENSPITYENGYYLMKATTKELGAKPVIKEAIDLGESKYKVIFASSDANVKEHFEATIQEKDNRLILLSYKKVVEATQ